MNLSGLKLMAGFALESSQPIDARIVVANTTERDELVTSNVVYPGMVVYVEADKKHYAYVDNNWKVFGSNEKDSNQTIVANGITFGADDAIEIDTSYMNIEQVINKVLSVIKV